MSLFRRLSSLRALPNLRALSAVRETASASCLSLSKDIASSSDHSFASSQCADAHHFASDHRRISAWCGVAMIPDHARRYSAAATGKVEGEGVEGTKGGAQEGGSKTEEAAADGEGHSEGVEAEAGDIAELRQQLKEMEAIMADKVASLQKEKDQIIGEAGILVSRAKRDSQKAKDFALQGFVKDLLEVVDNLERAAASVSPHALTPAEASESEETNNLRKLLDGLLGGVKATENIMLEMLKKHNVEQLDPTGQVFNPDEHASLAMTPDPTKEAGTVHTVVKKGYKLHDRIIRAADVIVVAKP